MCARGGRVLLAACLMVSAPGSRAALGQQTANAEARSALMRSAEEAMRLGPFSVMQKTRVPPRRRPWPFTTHRGRSYGAFTNTTYMFAAFTAPLSTLAPSVRLSSRSTRRWNTLDG